MALLRLFKLPKPKKFNYTPLYYDAKKEASEERKKRMETTLSGSHIAENDFAERISGSMHSKINTAKNKKTNKERATANIRLLVIVSVLLFLTWYFILR